MDFIYLPQTKVLYCKVLFLTMLHQTQEEETRTIINVINV